jgi:ribosome-associated translation inhibitor RaiA
MQNSANLPEATDRELKAYIYQQLMEIQPYLLNDSQVAVTVSLKHQRPKKKKHFLVTLSAKLEDGRMETEGQDGDVYQAFGKAKDLMLLQLAELQNALMDPAEREVEVQTALAGGFTVH